MGLSGKRDEDAELERLKKQEELEVADAKKRGRPRKDFTEVIEERAADRIPKLTDKALDALERGITSSSEKVAVDAASKYFKIFHRPTQKVDVNGPDTNQVHIHMQKSQDSLGEGDQKLLGELLDILGDMKNEDTVIDVEIIEDSPSEPTEDNGIS